MASQLPHTAPRTSLKMNCFCGSIKYLLFAFNLVFALGGIAVIVVGAILQANLNYLDDFFVYQDSIPAVFLIVVGCVIFLISSFGCYGAIQESRCMLTTFAACLGITFALLLTGTALAVLFLQHLEGDLENTMRGLMSHYPEDTEAGREARLAWDTTQKAFECCGVMGPKDWMVPPALGGPGLQQVPKSCLCSSDLDCLDGVYYSGCHNDVYSFVRYLQTLLYSISGGLAVMALVGIVVSCLLTDAIRRQKRRDLHKGCSQQHHHPCSQQHHHPCSQSHACSNHA